jgi:hypothetical protein
MAGEITHNWHCPQGLQCNCGRQTRFEIFIHNLKIWRSLCWWRFSSSCSWAPFLSSLFCYLACYRWEVRKTLMRGDSRHLLLCIWFSGMPRLRQSWTGYSSSMLISSESADESLLGPADRETFIGLKLLCSPASALVRVASPSPLLLEQCYWFPTQWIVLPHSLLHYPSLYISLST